MVAPLELHEELMQHVEKGGGKLSTLSTMTMLVAGLLAISYLSQLVALPFVLGVMSVTAN